MTCCKSNKNIVNTHPANIKIFINANEISTQTYLLANLQQAKKLAKLKFL